MNSQREAQTGASFFSHRTPPLAQLTFLIMRPIKEDFIMKRFINGIVLIGIGFVCGGIYACDRMCEDEVFAKYWKEAFHAKESE